MANASDHAAEAVSAEETASPSRSFAGSVSRAEAALPILPQESSTETPPEPQIRSGNLQGGSPIVPPEVEGHTPEHGEALDEAAVLKDVEREYAKVKPDIVEDRPEGIPRLAAFLHSDESFTIFRAFGETHARVLIHLQFEITELENELLKLDEDDGADESTKYRLTTLKFVDVGSATRRKLVQQLKEKLQEYDDFILKYSRVQALGKPAPENYRHVFDWIVWQRPVWTDTRDFIYHKEDFVTVKQEIHSGNWFEKMIDSHANKNPKSFIKKLLTTKKERQKTKDPDVSRYSPDRLALISRLLSIFLATALLLVPVFLLYLIEMPRVAMTCTVLAFVLVFSGAVAWVTDGKPGDVFIGTAAYSAVLVVFLGNVNQAC